MRAENLDFGEALKSLAEQAGVTLPNRERRAGEQAASNANDAALHYFRELLYSTHGRQARNYLQKRGLKNLFKNRCIDWIVIYLPNISFPPMPQYP